MTNFPKNKFLLLVAFLATVAIVSDRLGYNRHTVDLPIQNKSIKTDITNTTNQATSSLLTKSQQAENSDSKSKVSVKVLRVDAKELVPVVRVIDGDTIVANINGLPVHVRLIGINSPELNDKRPQVACLAQKAKEEAQRLLNGQNIYLEKDPTQGDYDKYNRLLAYVLMPNGSVKPTVSSTNFNELMIENGYAYEYTYRLPYKYQNEFKAAQNDARNSQKGLWSSNVCSN